MEIRVEQPDGGIVWRHAGYISCYVPEDLREHELLCYGSGIILKVCLSPIPLVFCLQWHVLTILKYGEVIQ